MRYFNTLSVAISILLNAFLAGKRYEMLSSRVYRCEWWFIHLLIDLWFEVLFDEDNHCQMCFETQAREGIYDLWNSTKT